MKASTTLVYDLGKIMFLHMQTRDWQDCAIRQAFAWSCLQWLPFGLSDTTFYALAAACFSGGTHPHSLWQRLIPKDMEKHKQGESRISRFSTQLTYIMERVSSEMLHQANTGQGHARGRQTSTMALLQSPLTLQQLANEFIKGTAGYVIRHAAVVQHQHSRSNSIARSDVKKCQI